MASSQLILVTLVVCFALPMIAAYENAPAKHVQKPVDAVVEGLVYCQSCENYGSWSFTGANPIGGAKVSVICKDYRNRVSFYKAFETDEKGYFYAELKGFKMGHSFLDHPLHSCKVKLVSSPLENCNTFSNINNGLNGSPLRYEDKTIVRPDYEAVIYTSGPLAFRPAYCPPKAD